MKAGVSCAAVGLVLAAAAPASAQEDEPSAGQAEGNAIVVTGTRILQRDYSSSTPLVTVSSDTLQSSAEVSIDQALKKLPQFTSGVGSQGVISSQDTQATPTNSPGIATLNLRGLGANRTLVLVDGRRTQPANAAMVVNIDTIPKAAIDSVEIITGGAGATYGADAVAGVVNFKLKRDFSGVSLDANYGVSSRGDGRQFEVSALLGGNFADGRGNAMIGLAYQDRNVVMQRDRPFFQEGFADSNISSNSFFGSSYVLTPTTNTVPGVPGHVLGFDFTGPNSGGLPTNDAINAVFAQYGFVPGDVTTAAASLYFNRAANPLDATLYSPVVGRISGIAAPNYNGNDPNVKMLSNGNANLLNEQGYLQTPLQRFSIFASGYYDVADSVTAYVQGKFENSTTATQFIFPTAFNQVGVGITFDAATCGAAVGHPVPQDLCDILVSRSNPDAPWGFNHLMDYMGPVRLEASTYTYDMLAGLRGDVGVKDWTFDAFASYGKTTQITRYENFPDLQIYQTVIGLPNYGANASFVIPRTLNGSCTSGLNPFTTAPVSQDCIDLIEAKMKAETQLEQIQAELNIQGGLLDLPAGEVRFAAGAAYRKNDFFFEPSGPLDPRNPNTTAIGVSPVAPTGGSISVKEIYGEILVPILADIPFIQSFNVNAGFRYSDYNTAGGVSTWKVIGDWEVNDWIKFRGGYQVANRAPNVAEVFQPGVYSTVAWPGGDPCSSFAGVAGYGNRADNPDRAKVQALCSALAGGFPVDNNFVGNNAFLFQFGTDETLGNPNLRSEKGKTFTVGAVLRSPFRDSPLLGNLTLSVDYYDIKIEGAISSLSTDFVYRQCFNFDGQSNPSYDPNNIFCTRVTRNPDNGNWLATQAVFENLGMIATAGIDANLSWSIPAPGIGGEGTVFTNVAFNYLDKFDVQNLPGGAVAHFRDTIGDRTYGAQFRWKLSTTVGYDFGPGMISLNWRHLPSVRYVTFATNPNAPELPTPSYNIFDLAARARVADNIEVRLGVDNLFDKNPLRIGMRPAPALTSAGSSLSSLTDQSYDMLGRRFYLGAKVDF